MIDLSQLPRPARYLLSAMILVALALHAARRIVRALGPVACADGRS